MNIIKVKEPNEKIIEQVIAFKKEAFTENKGFKRTSQFLYFKKGIFRRFVSNPNAELYIAKEEERVFGFAFLSFLDWDSKIF